MSFFDGTTFGMEFDCGEFDRRIALPGEHTYCTDEVASHTSRGIGADPSLTYNLFGGEVQFAPQKSERELFLQVQSVLGTCLIDDLNFPGTIHMHIRIPKLLEQPELIKEFVVWTTNWWPKFIPYIYKSEQFDNDGAYNHWLYACNWDVKTLTYPIESLQRMQNMNTPADIAQALHNWPSDWKNEWHIKTDKVKRPGVNFGHLALNETIEFRSFVTTTTPEILWNIITFPLNFTRMFITQDSDPLKIVRGVRFQDHPYRLPNYQGVAERTSGYFNDHKHGILVALINGDITVADLNYPEYWISKGFQ